MLTAAPGATGAGRAKVRVPGLTPVPVCTRLLGVTGTPSTVTVKSAMVAVPAVMALSRVTTREFGAALAIVEER